MSFFFAADETEKEPKTGTEDKKMPSTNPVTQNGIHFFTATWCGHCKKMKSGSPGVTEPDVDYPAVEHDADRSDWRSFWDPLGIVEGYPTVAFKQNDKIELLSHTSKRKKEEIKSEYAKFEERNAGSY